VLLRAAPRCGAALAVGGAPCRDRGRARALRQGLRLPPPRAAWHRRCVSSPAPRLPRRSPAPRPGRRACGVLDGARTLALWNRLPAAADRPARGPQGEPGAAESPLARVLVAELLGQTRLVKFPVPPFAHPFFPGA